MPELGDIYAKVIRRTRIWWRVRVYARVVFGDNELARYDVPFGWWARSKARRAVAKCVRARELRARYADQAYRVPENSS